MDDALNSVNLNNVAILAPDSTPKALSTVTAHDADSAALDHPSLPPASPAADLRLAALGVCLLSSALQLCFGTRTALMSTRTAPFYYDNGASDSITPDASLLVPGSAIPLNPPLSIGGVGSGVTATHTARLLGFPPPFNNAFFCPEALYSLFSLGNLVRNGGWYGCDPKDPTKLIIKTAPDGDIIDSPQLASNNLLPVPHYSERSVGLVSEHDRDRVDAILSIPSIRQPLVLDPPRLDLLEPPAALASVRNPYTVAELNRARLAAQVHDLYHAPNAVLGTAKSHGLSMADFARATELYGPCEPCHLSNQHDHKAHPPSTLKVHDYSPGELLHVDIITLPGGSKHLQVIDEATGYSHVERLDNDSKCTVAVASALRRSIAFFKSFGHTPRAIRSDSERVLLDAGVILRSDGITHEITPPGLHSKECERGVQTTGTKATALRHGALFDTPPSGEHQLQLAAADAVNLLPNSKTPGSCPYEKVRKCPRPDLDIDLPYGTIVRSREGKGHFEYGYVCRPGYPSAHASNVLFWDFKGTGPTVLSRDKRDTERIARPEQLLKASGLQLSKGPTSRLHQALVPQQALLDILHANTQLPAQPPALVPLDEDISGMPGAPPDPPVPIAVIPDVDVVGPPAAVVEAVVHPPVVPAARPDPKPKPPSLRLQRIARFVERRQLAKIQLVQDRAAATAAARLRRTQVLARARAALLATPHWSSTYVAPPVPSAPCWQTVRGPPLRVRPLSDTSPPSTFSRLALALSVVIALVASPTEAASRLALVLTLPPPPPPPEASKAMTLLQGLARQRRLDAARAKSADARPLLDLDRLRNMQVVDNGKVWVDLYPHPTDADQISSAQANRLIGPARDVAQESQRVEMQKVLEKYKTMRPISVQDIEPSAMRFNALMFSTRKDNALKSRLCVAGIKSRIPLDAQGDTFAGAVDPVHLATVNAAFSADSVARGVPLIRFSADLPSAFLQCRLTRADTGGRQVVVRLPSDLMHPLAGTWCEVIGAHYGLPWAGRIHAEELTRVMATADFHPAHEPGHQDEPLDRYVYRRVDPTDPLLHTVVCITVDDFSGNSFCQGHCDELERVLQARYGAAVLFDYAYNKHVGQQYHWEANGGFTVDCSQYTLQTLKRWGLDTDSAPDLPGCSYPSPMDLLHDCDDKTPFAHPDHYASIIGELFWIMKTRVEIQYPVKHLSKFQAAPTRSHVFKLLHVLRYLRYTSELGLTYFTTDGAILHGHVDASYGTHLDGDSQGAHLLSIGKYSAPIYTHSSKIGRLIPSSPCHAEYFEFANVVRSIRWLRQFLTCIGYPQLHPTPVWIDNLTAKNLAESPVIPRRSRCILIDEHVCRQAIRENEIVPRFQRGVDQRANVLTKSLSPLPFVSERYQLLNQGFRTIFNKIIQRKSIGP